MPLLVKIRFVGSTNQLHFIFTNVLVTFLSQFMFGNYVVQ